MKILSIDFPITQTGKNFTKDLFICPKIYDQQRKDAFYKRFKIGRCFLTNFPIVMIHNESDMFGRISETIKSQDQAKEQNKPQQLTLFD